MADYYRKTVNNTANDVKLKMQMAAFTLKLSENNDKIDDLLKADKDIKKDITDNSNNIKNIKNEIDLKLSDKVDQKYINDTLYDKKYIDDSLNDKVDKTNIDNLLSDNYYDKNNINLKFNDLYNKIYLDNKFDNIYDKTEVNDIKSKLNRNIVLFNTNLTNHIDKYSNEKKILMKI